jgi:hypothetical protein
MFVAPYVAIPSGVFEQAPIYPLDNDHHEVLRFSSSYKSRLSTLLLYKQVITKQDITHRASQAFTRQVELVSDPRPIPTVSATAVLVRPPAVPVV